MESYVFFTSVQNCLKWPISMLELHQYMKLFSSLLLKIVVCSTGMLLLNGSDEGRLCRAGMLCLIPAFVNIYYWVVLSTEPTA